MPRSRRRTRLRLRAACSRRCASATSINAPATSERFKEGPNYRRVVPAQPTGVAARQSRSHRSVLVRLRPLLPARSRDRVVAQEGQAAVRRVHARAGDVERHAADARAAVLRDRSARQARRAAHGDLSRDSRQQQSAEHDRQDEGVLQAARRRIPRNSRRPSPRSAWSRKCSAPTSSTAATGSTRCRRSIVNGKYVTDEGKAGGERELFDLIDELAAHEHGG